jgi:MFS family permease
MYQIENTGALLKGDIIRARRWPRVSRTVVLLGLVSLFTDISAEMVATVLPLYLVFNLGLSPLQFGAVDGVYQGAAALVRVAGGFVGDRWRRYKEVAAVGYGVSAVCKLAFLPVGAAWTALTWIVFIDRTGKGIRTAPRDALISLSTPRERLGTAFGVHRALDTAGAMIGPLLAFTMLTFIVGAFDAIFVVSFCLAVIGFGILVTFVRNPKASSAPATGDPEEEGERASLRSAAALLLDRHFRTLVLIGSGLALATVSDGFVYLTLQRRLDFDPTYLPLLYVGTALAYMLLAIPAGRLADAVGRGRVFLAGYGLLVLGYASLLLPTAGIGQLFVYLFLFGAFFAATDGVLMALASAVVPEHLRASGLSLLVSATSLARLLSSVLFGALWTAFGVDVAVGCFAGALAVAIPLAAAMLARAQGRVAYG